MRFNQNEDQIEQTTKIGTKLNNFDKNRDQMCI